ncbi:MAG: 3-hydroxyisobutyrate dehydrogenase [Candidatus Eremiobacteraeota bacterium]|nr:3-hydroxyisobutyrate dehydrogenase [Candidatus Eremiobacteraeota bacterium]MCW5869274.1 3-hydroxyisobutyrate dehydrogenase [Candidatus Eremiobacteraeota bacterium]
MKTAFLGLGNMGRPMALNLHKSGLEVVGFDLATSCLELAREAGLQCADSAREAARGAGCIISMLPASAHVEALYLGEQGLMAELPSNTLVIDCSTIAPDSARKVANEAQRRGLVFLDAPVSGGTAGAAAGSLSFMAGGTAEAFERARPWLEKMGANLFHAGASGAGQVAKMCNNMLLAVLMIGTSEALTLGQAHGLDPAVLSEIMTRSSGNNWALEKYNPVPGVMANVPAAKAYAGGFASELMLKDLGLAQEAAAALKASIPLGSLARNLYAAHGLAGHSKLDFSSIIKLFQEPPHES